MFIGSKFGAVFDMVTDRSTTTCLLAFLAIRYPHYLHLFQFLITLDFSSHYIHMYSSLVGGSSSHKKLEGDKHWLLRLYYHNTTVLFFLCAANELFWLLLYLHSFGKSIEFRGIVTLKNLEIAAYVVMPFCAFKHIMNFVQLMSASLNLANMDMALALADETHLELVETMKISTVGSQSPRGRKRRSVSKSKQK